MFSLGNLREMLISFLYSMPAIIIALSFHEYSHGLCAYALGDPTAKNAGRLTLNPARHFDPLGLIMLIVVHFGWAKPVPINSAYFKNQKVGIVLCSLAGPLSNLLLAFASLNAMGLVVMFRAVLPETLFYILLNVLNLLVSYNLVFSVFNLIPISPLDGSKVLYALLPQRIYYKILQYEQYGMILLIVLMFVRMPNGWGLQTLLTTAVDGVYESLRSIVSVYLNLPLNLSAFGYYLL